MRERERLLDQAAELITGPREEAHGDAQAMASRTAALWSAYMDMPFSPADVMAMMALLKLARGIAGDASHRDHWVDALGYMALAGELTLTRTIPSIHQT